LSLTAVVLSPFILAMLVPLLGKVMGKKIGWAVSLLPLTLFIWFAMQLPKVMSGEAITVFYEWIPSMGINFSLYLDGLSLLFGFLIAGIGFAVVIYSIFYLCAKENLTNFYVFILLFMGAMLGVVTSNNLVLMYLFWELTSFSSFLLIGFWYYKERSRYGAQKSMLITVMGGFSMLAGMILLWVTTGTFEIRGADGIVANAALIKESALYIPIALLILFGAFTKSAQVPFHIWLPDAMEAPTPISAYLHSATMVKAGIYLIALMTPALGGTEFWMLTVSGIGITTLLLGSYLALRQKDLKAILAFSTVSQLGLVITLIGYGTPAAILAGIFHLFNHSAFKGSLFMMVGIVDHETGTRDISKLRGLAKVMPVTATIAGIGTLAMAGLPPFNGFLSKDMFFKVSLDVVQTSFAFMYPYGWIFPVVAIIASTFTFIYSISILLRVFFSGELTTETPKVPHEAPFGLLAPAVVLAGITVIVGIAPNLITKAILEPAVLAVYGSAYYGATYGVHIQHWHGIGPGLWIKVGIIVAGLLLYFNLERLKAVIEGVPSIIYAISSNRFYDWALPATLSGALKVTNAHMTGRLRDYNLIIMLYVVLVVGATIYFQDAFRISTANLSLSAVSYYEVILGLILAGAAIGVVFANSRLSALVSLGVVGLMVAFFFALFRAPDLVLTQLIIETVTLALFLMAFSRLPGFLNENTTPVKIKLTNGVVAISVGVMAAVLTLIGYSNRYFDSIAYFFIENSYELGGGTNAVNVVLVDFRGLDTLGEAVVLGIAGLGVYAMIKLALGKKEEKAHGNE